MSSVDQTISKTKWWTSSQFYKCIYCPIPSYIGRHASSRKSNLTALNRVPFTPHILVCISLLYFFINIVSGVWGRVQHIFQCDVARAKASHTKQVPQWAEWFFWLNDTGEPGVGERDMASKYIHLQLEDIQGRIYSSIFSSAIGSLKSQSDFQPYQKRQLTIHITICTNKRLGLEYSVCKTWGIVYLLIWLSWKLTPAKWFWIISKLYFYSTLLQRAGCWSAVKARWSVDHSWQGYILLPGHSY